MSESDDTSNLIVVNVRYPDVETGQFVDNKFCAKPDEYKTYKEFLTAALHSVKCDYLPIKSFIAKLPNGNVEQVHEVKFRMPTVNKYVITVINPLYEAKKLRKRLAIADSHFDEFLQKNGMKK